MANNHGYISSMHTVCTNVDAYTCAGIATEDLDNGVVVTLKKISQESNKDINGFEFEVAKASAATTYADAWVVNNAEAGTKNLEAQLFSDPRYYYTPAGEPLHLEKYQADVDCIEADKNTFANATLPTSEKYVIVGANGKYEATNSKPAAGIIYWDIMGFNHVAVGNQDMKTVVLRTRVSAGA